MLFENISLKKSEIYPTFFSNFCLFHFWILWELDIPEGLFFSPLHIAINSSLSSVLFNFADIFILRNIKSLSKSCFSSLWYPQFWCMFFKKHVQISDVSVITIAVNDNNSKKLDESWTCPTFLQLNGWGENCQIFLNIISNFYISI